MKTINDIALVGLMVLLSCIISAQWMCNHDASSVVDVSVYDITSTYEEFYEMLCQDESWSFYRYVYSGDDSCCNVRLTKYGKLKMFLLENGVRWVAINDKGYLRVSIFENDKIYNLDFLKGLPIISLTIRQCCNLTDISEVKGLPLVHLDLSALNISNINDVQGSLLMHIRMFDMPVNNLAPLRKCTGLRSVVLCNLPVHDLQPLKDLSLKSVFVKNICTTDLSPLLKIKGLKSLEAGCGYVVCGNPD